LILLTMNQPLTR